MFGRIFICSLLTVFLLTVAEAQQPGKIPSIGFLQRRVAPTPGNPDPLADAFLQGLRYLGYVDGKNIRIEHRYAGGRSDRLPGLVAELVQLKVDVIVVASIQAIRVANQATKTIPIVIVTQADPVTDGLVDSLARPGGNVTGFTTYAEVLVGKRLELLKETVPSLSRVAVLWNSQFPEASGQWKESQQVARELGLQPHSMEPTNWKRRSKRQLRPAAAVSPLRPACLTILTKSGSRTLQRKTGYQQYTIGNALSPMAA
jgi:putative ABC transport system substrate-binding protein